MHAARLVRLWSCSRGADGMPIRGGVSIPDGSITPAKLGGKYYRMSSGTYVTDDTAETTTSPHNVYQLKKEFTLPGDFPSNTTLRIQFQITSTNAGYTTYARIYKNGAAVGTERSTTSGEYVSYDEDITGWSAGDKIQLYIRCSADSAGKAYCKGLRILGDALFEFTSYTITLTA